MEHNAENKVGLEMRRNVSSLGEVEDLKARLVEQAEVIAKLQSHEERYRSILETTNAVAWEVDVKCLQFTYISPQI